MAEKDADVYRHNVQQLSQLQIGDLIEFSRGIYSHWAVYIGDGEVVHLAGEEDDGLDANPDLTHLFTICGRQFSKALIKIDNFWKVAGNSKAVRNNKKDKKWKPLPPEEIVTSALGRLGRVGYNILYNNCEHFAFFCRYGIGKSDQADSFLTGLSVVTAILATAGILFGLSQTSKSKDKQKDRHSENPM